jgi:hypothetical protein
MEAIERVTTYSLAVSALFMLPVTALDGSGRGRSVLPNSFERFAFGFLNVKEIPAHLQVHPEVSRYSKKPRQPQCGAGRNPSAATDDLVDTLIGDTNGVGEFSLRQAHRSQKLL